MEPKQAIKQIVTDFTGWFAGLNEIWNYDTLSTDDIRAMLRDETVAAGLSLLVSNVVGKIGEYVHPDNTIAEFVKKNLESLETGFSQVLKRLVKDYYVFGHACAEIVWDEQDGKLVLKRLVPLEPELIRFKVSANQITHVIYGGLGQEVEIPIWKVFLIVRNKKNNGFGESILKTVYRLYKFKEILFKFWALAMERFAAPIIVGKTIGDTSQMLEALKTLWQNGAIAIDGQDDVQLLSPGEQVANNFMSALEYANTLILRALLVPQLLIKTEQIGTYALAKVHLDVFDRYVTEEAFVLSDAFVDQVIARTLEFNFGTLDNYGRFAQLQQADAETQKILSDVFATLIEAGVLDPAVDNAWMRSWLKMPKVDEVYGE